MNPTKDRAPGLALAFLLIPAWLSPRSSWFVYAAMRAWLSGFCTPSFGRSARFFLASPALCRRLEGRASSPVFAGNSCFISPKLSAVPYREGLPYHIVPHIETRPDERPPMSWRLAWRILAGALCGMIKAARAARPEDFILPFLLKSVKCCVYFTHSGAPRVSSRVAGH